MSHLSIKNLRKVFVDSKTSKEVVAVQDFNLEVEKAEMITLLGPSGCGKTTVLRMLAGFEEPTAGSVYLNGKNIAHLPPNKRDSSMVFQSYALFPHMSVLENIEYGLKLRAFGREKRSAKTQEIMELVGLKGFENRRPNELSGGQQQRVALARALVVEPEILLFDEPLSNLDAKLRESMRNEIRKLQKRLSITSVYVTHDQIEAMAISDRIIVMNSGNVEQVGSPQEVYFRPASLFAADFMGATNFLECKVNGPSRINVEGINLDVPSDCIHGSSLQKPILVARPESVLIRKSGGAFKAKVLEHHYLGAAHEYVIQTESGQRLTARLIAQPKDKRLSENHDISFDLDPENLSILDSY